MNAPLHAGAALRIALTGAWRKHPPGPIQEAMLPAMPLLLSSGAHGLAWRRIPRRCQSEFAPLRDAYRQSAVAQLEYEDRLRRVVDALHRGGIDALLLKGWSVARLYPEIGLRPCGDIDIAVPPEQFEQAGRILQDHPDAAEVDLHAGVADLDDRTWDDVFQRRRVVRLGDMEIPILGAEDQLRHLCLHLMRHGAYRPLWLCDIAVAGENRPADFDWDYCLHGERRLTEWTLCALALAGKLLDARIDEPRAQFTAPDWIIHSVLRDWSDGASGDSHMRDPVPLVRHWRHPGRLLGALRARWPNPIEAAFKVGASPRTPWPVLFHQLRYAARRAIRLPAKVRRASAPALPFQVHESESAVTPACSR